MKKYSKINSQSSLKQEESSNQENSDPITQIYKENELKNDYIYVIDPQKKNVIKTRNRGKTDNLNKTVKMETKTIKIFENVLKEEKVDLIKPVKKSVKKKKIKKKKKSVKKFVTPGGELEKTNSENNIKGLEGETPIPNGNNNGVNNYYLINYKPKKKRSNYRVTEIRQIITEDYYNTFHENDFEKNFKELNLLEEPPNTAYQEKNKKYNFSVPSNPSNQLTKSQNSQRVARKDKINPEKLSFDNIENYKEEINDENDVKHDKLRRIKFRKKETNKENKENKDNKVIDLIVNKNKENEKDKYIENDTSDDNSNDKDKDKERNSKTPQTHKKKKRFISKKKYSMNIISIIKIQSMWRKYKIRKINELKKKFEIFSNIFKSLLSKRLKRNLRFLFEKIRSIINSSNSENKLNNNKVNKVSKDKKKKKVKTKKIKMKNIAGKSFNSSFEKEGSFKISEDDKISNDYSNDNSNYNSNDNHNNLKHNLLEDDKKLFINNEEEEEKSTFPNNKDSNIYDSTSTENYYLLKDHNSSNNLNNDNINNNNLKKVKNNIEGHQILGQINKDQLLKNVKIKSKLKVFSLQKKIKNESKNLSLSCDNLAKRKYIKPEVKPPNLKKKSKKSLDNSGNFNSIPLINNDYLNRSFSKNKFQNESLINCHNDDLYFISNKRKMSYYKKIIGENPFTKSKPKKTNKIDISAIKFVLKTKEVLSKIVKKKFFYYLIGYLNAISLLQNLINIFNKKKIALLKNSFNDFKIKIEMLKLIDNIKRKEKTQKKTYMEISKNMPIFINRKVNEDKKRVIFNENCVETNELFIARKCKKNEKRTKNENLEMKANKFGNEKLLIIRNISKLYISTKNIKNKIKNIMRIDKNVISFKINKNFTKKEDGLNGKKLMMNKNIPKIDKSVISFKINKSYEKKEDGLNGKKLMMHKNIPKIDKSVISFKINKSYEKKEDALNGNKLMLQTNIPKIDKSVISFKINKSYEKKEDAFSGSKLKMHKNIPSFEINKIIKEKYLLIDNINEFDIKRSYQKEIKFNENKLKMSKNISEIKINKQKNSDNKFIIDKNITKFNIKESYKREIKFNKKKLIISRIVPKINIKKIKNKKAKLIIDKVITEFNITKVKKPSKFIISKVIKESPIINKKKKAKNILKISKVIDKLNIKGILKKNVNVIDRVNDDYIIDDIESYNKNNKIKFYYSLIMNNINNLIINNIITDFNIISHKAKNILSIATNELFIHSTKNNNYIITKNISDYILGNKFILKNLYKFNENKLIITKVIKNYMLKMKGVEKLNKQILFSTSLLKMKAIIVKSAHKFIYKFLISIHIKNSFCNHMSKFNNININLMKIEFFNNIKNKKLEEKYKKLFMNDKFNDLVINRIIKYEIAKDNDNSLKDDSITNENENEINHNIEENSEKLAQKLKKNKQLPKHYMIHKIKLSSMNNDNQDNQIITRKMPKYEEIFLKNLYAKRNKNFIKGNIVSRVIELYIINNNLNLKEELPGNNNSEINSNKQTPIKTPRTFGDVIKKENKNKIYISRLKMSNSKNYNNSYNKTVISNNSNNKKGNFSDRNCNNNIAGNTYINNNNNINIKINIVNKLSNSYNSINNNIFNNTYTNMSSLNKMKECFLIYNSPPLDFQKTFYTKNKTNDENNVFSDKIKNIKEKRLDFNENIYKDIQKKNYQNEQKDRNGKLYNEINEGKSKEEKDINEQNLNKEEIASTKNNLKPKNNISFREKKYEKKEDEKQAEKINNNESKNNRKDEIYEEEEEEEEIEEEEDEGHCIEDIKPILIKYINKKNDILNKKLLNALRKWRKVKNCIPIIYTKNNNIIRPLKKMNKIEISKVMHENTATNRNKKLLMIYMKYKDYSCVMKRKYLKKWKKIIEKEKSYVNKEEEENEDEEEEEEIEKNE